MSQRAGSRARGYLSRGALLALLLHVHLLAPIGVAIWVFGGRQEAAREAQRAQEVDVEFRDVTAAELPKDLPPLDPAPPDQLEPPEAAGAARPGAQARAEARRRRRRRTRPPRSRWPSREPEVAEPPPPPTGAERKAHEKMVDLDNDKDDRAAARREVPGPEEQPRRPRRRARRTRTSRRRRRARRRRRSHRIATMPSPAPTSRRSPSWRIRSRRWGARRPMSRPTTTRRSPRRREDDARKSLLALRDPRRARTS